MTKIIFLDIDGVMNHEQWYKSNDYQQMKKETENQYHISQFDPSCILTLNSITDITGAKIVISSTWRLGRTINELKNLFKTLAIEGDIIGLTPLLQFKNKDYDYSVPRGCEIKAWLEMNKDKLGSGIGKYKNYVILDDDSDMLYWQRNNFIKIDRFKGLSYPCLYKEQITNILNQ